jgi:hypothetical protein
MLAVMMRDLAAVGPASAGHQPFPVLGQHFVVLSPGATLSPNSLRPSPYWVLIAPSVNFMMLPYCTSVTDGFLCSMACIDGRARALGAYHGLDAERGCFGKADFAFTPISSWRNSSIFWALGRTVHVLDAA